jgi:hypothetical protein
MEGAAAIVFGFSFLGFFASRLPRCSPLGMRPSSVCRCRHIISLPPLARRNDPVLAPRPILLKVLQHIARDPQGHEFSRPWNCRRLGAGCSGGFVVPIEGSFRCIARAHC